MLNLVSTYDQLTNALDILENLYDVEWWNLEEDEIIDGCFEGIFVLTDEDIVETDIFQEVIDFLEGNCRWADVENGDGFLHYIIDDVEIGISY